VLVACHVSGRDQGFDVFDVESAFSTDSVLREEVVQRCSEELAVDEEFQGDWLVGVQEAVDQCGELVAFEVWDGSVSVLFG
jgi:hypothetical protein